MIERLILALLLLSLVVIAAMGDDIGPLLPNQDTSSVRPGVTTGNTNVTPVRMVDGEPIF